MASAKAPFPRSSAVSAGHTFNPARGPVKPLHHHVQRLAVRLLQAEVATTHAEAEHVLRKAEKHERRIAKWRRRLERLNLWNQ